jgi:isochorismate synthase EntC
MPYDNEFYGYTNDDDAESYASDSKMTNKMKREMAELNKEDKYFFQMKRKPNSYSTKTINVFGSGDIGAPIRDAVSGIRNFGHRVGSASEDLYFKARICTGEFGNREAPTLFFDSPEQYERHMLQSLDAQAKMRWHKKNQIARREADGQDEPRNMKILTSGQRVTVVK